MIRLEHAGPLGDWHQANQRHLAAGLAVLAARIAGAGAGELERAERALAEAAAQVPGTPALLALAARFQLSRFERELVLLCAGVELDGELATRLGGRPPSFALALAHLPEPHWSALTPGAPLRRHRLLEVAADEPLTRATLRIDERILHFLAGVDQVDERLADVLAPMEPAGELPASQGLLADRLAGLWRDSRELPVIQLVGDDPAAKRAIAAAACARLDLQLHVLPVAAAEPGLTRLLGRELLLADAALFVDAEELAGSDSLTGLRRLLDQLDAPVVIATREPLRLGTRTSVQLTAERPTHVEQEVGWRRGLAGRQAELAPLVAPLVAQFDLPTPAIRNACAATVGLPAAQLPDALWEACRAESRGRLDDLAQRIEPSAGWDELVLPTSHKATLLEIVAQVRQRSKVHDAWGFSGKGKRGLGMSALFAGASGTGKTMAAEVLAATLRLDLYRIDLSQVVNKYIGETEKNLRRVFDAAEHGAAILLFDEADALFGQRSEVKDSHDRYANIEVGYLLQRMEAYRGLAILTTNLKNALDTAFLRRLRFVVQFPFPGAGERAAIWRAVFPAGTPTRDLDFERLARLNVAGGSIRNIALNAAFLAASADEPVGMGHIARAAQVEYAKLERPFSSAELG